VQGDAALLRQVFANLLASHQIHASPPAGQIEIGVLAGLARER